jgi:hypothetical protein
LQPPYGVPSAESFLSEQSRRQREESTHLDETWTKSIEEDLRRTYR